ncbi:carboxypeptidase [Cryptosporidium ubiquitum]|uniref:Carboxypeptidase n=1 Tax=Cryptosporidium ubiquitum TaxID=857276 RepID=A0A1J4MIP0_9CRYT|nr:carboxypeptidase [Cryptosporidium ubiquitum]OII72717.1 carboxypeptidase [Cryptosporidium ubiquitum]
MVTISYTLFFVLILVLSILGGYNGMVYGFEMKDFESYLRSLIGFSKNNDSTNEKLKYKYKSYMQHFNLLQELELKCSNIIKIYNYTSKKNLYCGESKCQYLHIKLGLSNLNYDVPNILLVSGIHGDEKLGVEIATEFVSSICDQYITNQNAGVKYLLSTRNIWIIPIANPWGFYHNKRTEEEIDVNRDFPSESGENCLQSESSRMIYDLFNLKSFVFVAALHGGLKSISYGNGYSDISDDNNKIFEFIAKDLQASAGKILNNNNHVNKLSYFYDKIGSIAKIVYPVKGGFEDWSFYGYNVNHISCSNYLQKTHSANQGGSMTFLIETDYQKTPSQDSLGYKPDLFSLIDLDKLSIQPSHITRNLRMLLKLVEYTYPDIIFFNKPPDTVYFGQTFVLYIAVIGCYSFSNLKLKLESNNSSQNQPEQQPIYLNFLVNEGLNGFQNTIYYMRCSSIFLNNQEIKDILSNNSLYSSKDKCNDSNLLTKIVNRSFRVKNKCKSIYQSNKFKPIKILVKVPTETKILNSINGEIEKFNFKVELEFDLELTQNISNSNKNLFEKFTRLRSSQNGNRIDRPNVVPIIQEYPHNQIQGSDPDLSHQLSGFQIKIVKPQEVLQIEFSSCSESFIQSNGKWVKSCLAFQEFTKKVLNMEEPSSKDSKELSNIMQYIHSNEIGTSGNQKIFLDNMNLIKENSHNELQGNLYVIPSEPRTSIISRNTKGGNEKMETIKPIPSLLENESEILTTLPYFNNITLELTVSISSEPKNNGEYVILKFPEFLNLLNLNIFRYHNIEKVLINSDKKLNSVGVISISDFHGDENEEIPFQSIKAISRQRIFEMVTDIQTKEDFNQFTQDDNIELLGKHYVILRYLKNNLISMALGKVYIDNYIKNSLGTNIQEFQTLKNTNINLIEDINNNIKHYNGIQEDNNNNSEPITALKQKLSLWWYNNSKDYVDFRLVLVFCGLFMVMFAFVLISIRILRYYKWVPFKSLKFELKKRFRTNSKIFTIDISSDEDSEKSEDKEKNFSGKRKKRRVKSRKIYDPQDNCYTPRSDYVSNKNYTLSQRFNTNNSEPNERAKETPSNSPSSKDYKLSNLNHTLSNSSLSSFDHFKSRTNTMKELEIIEMERNLDIGMLNPNQNNVLPKNTYTELSTSISKNNAKNT